MPYLLVYSTYLGGSGQDRGCCVDRQDSLVLISGDSDGGMPQAGTPYDATRNCGRDAFIATFVSKP